MQIGAASRSRCGDCRLVTRLEALDSGNQQLIPGKPEPGSQSQQRNNHDDADYSQAPVGGAIFIQAPQHAPNVM
jgi:hypothetical protein